MRGGDVGCGGGTVSVSSGFPRRFIGCEERKSGGKGGQGRMKGGLEDGRAGDVAREQADPKKHTKRGGERNRRRGRQAKRSRRGDAIFGEGGDGGEGGEGSGGRGFVLQAAEIGRQLLPLTFHQIR